MIIHNIFFNLYTVLFKFLINLSKISDYICTYIFVKNYTKVHNRYIIHTDSQPWKNIKTYKILFMLLEKKWTQIVFFYLLRYCKYRHKVVFPHFLWFHTTHNKFRIKHYTQSAIHTQKIGTRVVFYDYFLSSVGHHKYNLPFP